MQFELRAPVITIGVGFAGFVQINQARFPGGNLDTAITELDGPAADAAEGVERRLVPHELREEQPGSLHRVSLRTRFHDSVFRSHARGLWKRITVPSSARCGCAVQRLK